MKYSDFDDRSPFFLGVFKLAVDHNLKIENLVEELSTIIKVLEDAYGLPNSTKDKI